MYGLMLVIHTLAAVIWVGGMFFAFMALRPAVNALLDPHLRLPLWKQVFERFFLWVWIAILSLFGSGLWIIFFVFGGMGATPIHVHTMLATGLLMTLLFTFMFFLPYQKMRRAVEQHDIGAAAKHLVAIRRVIDINLILGALTLVIASGARYWY
jgi:uncharacterized membrane protein